MSRLKPAASVRFIGVMTLALSALVLSQSARADQILEIHDGSLTTYLPSSKSNIQDIRPLVDERGTNIDGSLQGRGGATTANAEEPCFFCVTTCGWYPPSISFGGGVSDDRVPPAWGSGAFADRQVSNIDLYSGTILFGDIDLSFPAQVPWGIARSYNARQKDSGGSYFASSGYQGKNWFQNSQPELVFFDSATDSEDTIYVIGAADLFLEFRRGDDVGQGDSADTFKAVNGAAGAILISEDGAGPDLATFYTMTGVRFVFFWVDDADIDDDIEGSIWRIIDTDGKIAYVGHQTDASQALTDGYDATTGAITTAYDSAGRRFTYTYTSGMLTQVKAEVNSGGWTEVGKVDYSYYVDANSHGEDDDLKLVTITTPLTDSGVSQVRKKHYWYYEGTYDATTNPGYHHQIQYIIDFEGYRKYDWGQDSNLDDDPLSATEANLKSYASAYFEYDTERRIVEAWFNGACGCSGAASGTHIFEYETNGSYTDNTGYDTTWKSRTIVKKPDVTYKTASGAIKSYITQYFDEVGQPLHRVLTDDDPDNTSPAPNVWATKVVRNSDGQITDIHSPANVTGYTHSTASFTTSTSAGLVTTYTRVTTGDMKGFVEDVKHKKGTSGSAFLNSTVEHTSATKTVGDVTITRPVISARWVYSQESTTEAGGGSGPSGAYETTFSYTFYTGDAALRPKQTTRTNPAVSTANNGSGSSTTMKRYLRKDGTTAFAESATGTFTYTQFTDGQLTKRIDDVKTNGTFPAGDDPNTDWGITETGDGLDRTTTLAFDSQRRTKTTTQPDGRVLKTYYSKLADGRLVTLRYADYEDIATDKYHGPVSYTVANHAGKAEVSATVELSGNESTESLTNHVNESATDPILAVETISNKLGDLARLTVNVYDETGTTLEESRSYFLIPASGSGTEGTNYDATFLGYDDQGRRYRTKAPTGTITRTDFDSLGRAVRQWVGDNDNAFDGGESSGSDNLVKTSENVYDSGNDKGNNYLTKRTAYVRDSDTDKRDTTFAHDVRGRALLTTTPTAPYPFNKYDNLGRLIASGQFSSTASIVVGTDDPTTETTNRLGLSQSFYDEMGRVWKSQRHKIDDADGSDDGNLQTLTWFDAAGRTIKVDGSQLTKTAFDRLGRQTHSFTLAKDNDSAYADADDVTGDYVLVESQTVYESTNSSDLLMRVTISREHDNSPTGDSGALDTNADADDLLVTAANLNGRAQITAMWYDRFGRVTDTVRYGTNGGSDFDRDGLSVPARSDTALLTERTYNDDGSIKSVTDPRNVETRFEYDDVGRRTAIINNYVNGTPSGTTGDDDVYTRFVYTDGLRTKMWVDFDGDNTVDTGDQDTIYTYGTTKGVSAGDSKIQTGHLLQKVQYPDSSGGTDVVTLAYNVQNQQIWTKDQEGNITERNFDDSGRVTHKRITTLDADFDGAVRRISTTYNNRGQRELVTQYDNATVGSGSVVDEVKFTYEDWGNVSKFEQDHDSAIGGTLLYDIDYTYQHAGTSNGRNTIRRTGMDLPDGTTVTFNYTGIGSFDDNVSRVTKVQAGGTDLAVYDYLGVGQVVGIDYPEPDVFSNRYLASNYDALDNFNRVEDDIWYKDLATDVAFFDLDITYDRNSNTTLTEDNIHVGFDADYTIDNFNRLQKTEEGTWNGSTITSRTRQQLWEDSSANLALDQVGNWDQVRLDLNGDNDFVDANEYDDDRTHNDANELTGRDTDDNGTDDFTLTYDAVGNLTDDAENYEYEYDPFGRMRKVKNTSTQALVAEYTYSGLGHRIGWHYDVDADGTVEDTSDDPWFRFVYDERWRIVGTFRASDSSPKEQFVYHNASADGRGGSSYIDTVICRDRDANVNWADAADGTLEERIYYCHNWRGDVSVLIEDDADMVEWVKYSSYGIPFGLPKGDVDSDGDLDSTDYIAILNWGANPYDVRADLNLDGSVLFADASAAAAASPITLGWGNLSNVGNRKGYVGYELDSILMASATVYFARERVLIADLGRWFTRSSLGRRGPIRTNTYRTHPNGVLGSFEFNLEAENAGVDNDYCIYRPLRWCGGSCRWQFILTGWSQPFDPVLVQRVVTTTSGSQCPPGTDTCWGNAVYLEEIPWLVHDQNASTLYSAIDTGASCWLPCWEWNFTQTGEVVAFYPPYLPANWDDGWIVNFTTPVGDCGEVTSGGFRAGDDAFWFHNIDRLAETQRTVTSGANCPACDGSGIACNP
ncbi:MAG: hypothetical protein V3T53_02430 [Phycisphaerales bacterium]